MCAKFHAVVHVTLRFWDVKGGAGTARERLTAALKILCEDNNSKKPKDYNSKQASSNFRANVRLLMEIVQFTYAMPCDYCELRL